MRLASLEIHHSMLDERIHAQSTIISLVIGDYLELTRQSEDNLQIQRKIISTRKVYERLRKDVRRGGTMPPLVLAVAEEVSVEHGANGAPLVDSLSNLESDAIYIVDGLQRTNQLRILQKELRDSPEELAIFLGRRLRVEIWTHISFPSILYRMMLLNAAQTPMTIKHQLEIANLHLIKLVRDQDPTMEVFTDREKRRRYKARQFQAADLVEGFTAFVKRTPLTESKSIVLEEIEQDDFIANFDETKYKDNISTFVSFLGQVDQAICDVYGDNVPGASQGQYSIEKGLHFFMSKPYLIGFCAAAGFAASRLTQKEFHEVTTRLISHIRSGDADPLGFQRFHQLIPDVLANAGRIGDAQREMVFNAFRRYLLDPTAGTFDEHWVDAARRI